MTKHTKHGDIRAITFWCWAVATCLASAWDAAKPEGNQFIDCGNKHKKQ